MAVEGASLDSIFCAAVEIASEPERAAYVAVACGENQALQAQVEKLLAAHFRAGSFLQQPAEVAAATGPFTPAPVDASVSSSGQAVGDVIGPYKLVEAIGEGGMGAVWLAQQIQPVKRLVALKVIKPGMDSKQVLARFEAERQALALMDHPNIARVFDAGTTVTGRPYFVMELVKGVPLTKYCDDHRLTPRERLGLFMPVCQAIQHAHQKGIIHRDVKPSNVLVALYDGKPVPKVIDFGIAKAAGQQLTEHTLVTGFGTVVGTLEYMSPEQAELNQLDIDTRSDVYSLGVLLYELLTGSPPFGRKELEKAGMLEMLRVIREQEPSKPSTKLSTAEGLPALAANRGTEPAKLTKLVRGELDWIVMKALEKDRSRRYDSANGLALDLQRYLADEPVLAAPPSAWYRSRKFASRHKAALTAATAVAAALVLAVVVLAVSSVLLRQEQAATEQAKGQKEEEYRGRIAALEGETRALGREKEALESWRQASYSMGITLALNEYQAADTVKADQLLDRLPEDLRRWEWHYLKRLVASELTTCRVSAIPRWCAFSPNGDRVAIVDERGLHLFDCVSGRERPGFGDAPRILGINEEGRCVDPAFSADGRHLACAAASAKGFLIQVRDANTGKVTAVKEFARQPKNDAGFEPLSALALSLNGELAALVDSHGHLYVWVVASGKELFEVVAHPGADPSRPSTSVAFNHDGTRLTTASEHEAMIKIWDPKTGKQVEALDPAEGFSTVVYSPKSRWVGATGRYKTGGTLESQVLTVSVWDTATRKRRHVFTGHTRPITCLAFSPDEQVLATGSGDQRLMLWDLTTGRRLATYCGQNAWTQAVSFRAGGKQIVSLGWYMTVGPGGLVKTWDATRPPEFVLRKRKVPYLSAIFCPDGRHMAWVDQEVRGFSVYTGDATSTAEAERVRFDDAVQAIAFDPRMQYLAAGLMRSGTDQRGDFFLGQVSVWDRHLGKVVRTYPAGGEDLIGPVQAVAYSPDGKLLAAAGWDRLIHVWDTTTGLKKFRLKGHESTVVRLAFSADGRRLTSASWFYLSGPFPGPLQLRADDPTKPREVRVWDTTTGAELQTMTWPPAPPSGQEEVSTDGDFITIRTSVSSATVYQQATRKELVTLNGLTREIDGAAVSRDGRRIITGGDLLRVWDAHTGQLILAVGDQYHPVGKVSFSPDDKKVLSAGIDGLRVWDGTPVKR